MNNIYLVGFMGTGKTAVGQGLARRLNLKFVDLDSIIEQKEGLKIVDIFATQGEAYFRDAETAALEAVSKSQDLIIACGGGIVLKEANISLMQDTGLCICLEARLDVIFQRVKRFTHRPLLNVEDPKTEIKELLDKRAPFYTKVRHHIDTSDLTIEQVADRVMEKTKNND
jgi:shikimate kinase